TEVFNQFVDVANETSIEDIFEIPKTEYTLYTRFFPDIFEKDGQYSTVTKYIKNPAFGIKITHKRDPFTNVWSGIVRMGEKAEFEGFVLDFSELKPIVEVLVTKDPTYAGIVIGWIIIVAGLTGRYLPYLWGKGEESDQS
ncbi:MAG: hypothetical protein KAR06_06475, partial [Deltaproteobacteria bacterium]|nr:hypothetical protein [Deltaproteobacteria bacterium]